MFSPCFLFRSSTRLHKSDILCFCRFDGRISSFAEQKFQRDGIEVLTGHRVLSVSDRMINMKTKSTGQNISIPRGMVVWSTGVGTRPVVKDFMEQIGQVRYVLWFMCFLYCMSGRSVIDNWVLFFPRNCIV